jgi:ABC-type glycerol-3-phosphate transport system substrate-binding protein
MKQAKKIILAVVAVAVLAGMVMMTGCSKGSEDEQVTLTFWHWWGDQHPLMEKMAVQYEEETGVKIIMELIGNSEYFKKLQAAAGANKMPDIIGLAGGGEVLARYVKAGRILELTEELNKETFAWRNTFFPRALEPFRYEEGNSYEIKGDSYWGLPITTMNIQIFYHKDIFEDAGLDPEAPPKTWSEFMEISKHLLAEDISPFMAGFGDLWIDYTFFDAYCWTYLGKDNMRKLYSGELPYTNEGCVKALQRVVDLRANNILYAGSVALPNKEAEINFANKKAAMMLNGSWGVNVYTGITSEKLDLGVFPFPKPDDSEYPMYLIGGVGSGCAITNNAEDPQEAIAFLRWFTSEKQQVRFAQEAHQIPANFQAMDDIDPILQGFAKGMRHLTPDIKLEEKWAVREVLQKGFQSILIGEKIPQEILEQAWEVKQKVTAKEKAAAAEKK